MTRKHRNAVAVATTVLTLAGGGSGQRLADAKRPPPYEPRSIRNASTRVW
jgi:hypothetical protein